MTKKQKQTLIRIITAAVLFTVLMILDHTGRLAAVTENRRLALGIYAVPYLIVGYDILWKAVRNISHGEVFDENFLMIVATFGAFGVQEYNEALAVMLFYQVGELFQSYAVGKSRQSISDLMEICPEYANIEKDGQLVQVDPEEIAVGDVIVVRPGERIPLDGVVTEGSSMIDTSALTGESVPRRAGEGDDVISGCVNGEGLLKIKAAKKFEDSTVSKILEMVEDAGSRKARTENFITRFARVYTPIVTIGAACLAVIPPLAFGLPFSDWLQRACVFLVISCPCALVISVPLGFFGGIGASSRIGVLVKGSNYLEAVADMTTLVFDKTGTLTKGEFAVQSVHPEGAATKEELLEIAALSEGYSSHPIAESIRAAYGGTPDMSRVCDAEEISGHGIHVKVDGRDVLLGNIRLMRQHGIECEELESGGTVIYEAVDGSFRGSIVISDTLKSGAAEAISEVKQAGVKKCVMLTGDREAAAREATEALGIDEVHAELLPGDKVEAVESLLERQGDKEKLGFVGDGINDAPVLTRADIGFAMGSMGSDAAIEAADIVVMDDDLRRIPRVVEIARRTLRIVKANIVFALAVKILVLILGALGIVNMWAAVFADVGVAIICIINSMRILTNNKY